MLPLLPDQVTSHLLAEGPVWAAAGAPLAGVPGPGARDLPARPPGVGAVRQQGALPGPVQLFQGSHISIINITVCSYSLVIAVGETHTGAACLLDNYIWVNTRC